MSKNSDFVRVLRVIEYSGPRAIVEKQVENSLQGGKKLPNGLVIKVATLGAYPEVLTDIEISTGWPEGSHHE